MNFIKTHWKNILTGLLVIFSLNKCTQSYNRSGEINSLKVELEQKDSIIKVQDDSIKSFSIRWEENQRGQANYQNLAVGTKEELVNENMQLKKENKQLTNENTQLKKKNKQLKAQINDK